MLEIDKPLDRSLFLSQDVDQESISEIIEKIILINKDDERLKKIYKAFNLIYTPEPIELYIDSYGGDVYSCYGLISVIENSKIPVHTIVTGSAMSSGFMILISGHKRFAHRLSTVLYHQLSHDTWGKIGDTEIEVDETKRLQKILEQEVVNKTKIKMEKLKEIKKTKTDWYISPEEALKLNIVDFII